MAIAIPPQDSNWPRLLPRPLYFSLHGYDWAPLLARSGRTFNLRARVFGAGVDLVLDEAQRRWSFSLGARWLINFAFGHSQATPKEYRELAGGLAPRSIWAESRYVEVTVLLLSLSCGRQADEPWRARLFFNGRRLFYKRGKHADRQG